MSNTRHAMTIDYCKARRSHQKAQGCRFCWFLPTPGHSLWQCKATGNLVPLDMVDACPEDIKLAEACAADTTAAGAR